MGDLYDVLGVPRNATFAEVKHAYREGARRFHPDTSADPAAVERFEEVRAAYEVLGTPKARASYDATLEPEAATALTVLPGVLPLPTERPRSAPPPPAGGSLWRLARALEAYRPTPRPQPVFVDVLAW
jgi:curved DNA-binding protein CbpA